MSGKGKETCVSAFHSITVNGIPFPSNPTVFISCLIARCVFPFLIVCLRMLDSWQDVAAGLYGTAKPSGKHPWPLDTVHVTDVSEDEAGEGIGSEDEADALEAERELEQDPLPHFDVKLR